MVGHNVVLDLMHTLKEFVGEVCSSWTEFRRNAHATFARIYDTKVVCSMQPFRALVGANPSLANLSERCVCVRSTRPRCSTCCSTSQHPFATTKFTPRTVEVGFDAANGTAYHSAGYDAFVTGQIFIALARYSGVPASSS
jgi:poly(A)-specific ribonuclease